MQYLENSVGTEFKKLKNKNFITKKKLYFSYFYLFNLLDEVGFLVVELIVVRPFGEKVGQELDQLRFVLQQDVQDGLRFLRVGHEHLWIANSSFQSKCFGTYNTTLREKVDGLNN